MTEKKRLLVCSEADIPSVNMKDRLIMKREWEDLGYSGRDRFLTSGDLVIMITPDLHIRMEDLDGRTDKAGLRIEEVIFMSKHSATSGEAALTVHPIGNYRDNRLGGRERTLVRSSPALMTDALRKI
jgi:D-aminoacyl-tRNA deacylase